MAVHCSRSIPRPFTPQRLEELEVGMVVSTQSKSHQDVYSLGAVVSLGNGALGIIGRKGWVELSSHKDYYSVPTGTEMTFTFKGE